MLFRSQWKKALTFRPEWTPLKAGDTVAVTGLAGPARAFFLKSGAAAGERALGAGVELAAPIHGFDSPRSLGPIIVSVVRALATGEVTVTASNRAIEPPLAPVQPLPGIVAVPLPK